MKKYKNLFKKKAIMRKRNFRGKRIDIGEWVYGALYIDILNNKTFIITQGIRETYGDYGIYKDYEVDPTTVGQYTSLKDKNGKEIYEGDIVEYTENVDPDGAMIKEIGVISFYNAGFWIQIGSRIETILCDVTEVIGNIHES